MASAYLVCNEIKKEYGIRCGSGEFYMFTVRDNDEIVIMRADDFSITKTVEIPDSLVYDLMKASDVFRMMHAWRGQIKAIIKDA